MSPLFRPVPSGVVGVDVGAAEHRRRGRLLARSTKRGNVENVERGQRLHSAQSGVLQLGPVRPKFVRVVGVSVVVGIGVGDVVAEPRLEDEGREKLPGRRRPASFVPVRQQLGFELATFFRMKFFYLRALLQLHSTSILTQQRFSQI